MIQSEIISEMATASFRENHEAGKVKGKNNYEAFHGYKLGYLHGFRECEKEIQSLKSQLSEALSELKLEQAVVGFYSNPKHWHPFRSFSDEWGAIDDSDWDYREHKQAVYLGGKRARQRIKERKLTLKSNESSGDSTLKGNS